MTHRRPKSGSASIFPIILAAGAAPRLGLPHALGEFAGRTAVEIAISNCIRVGLRKPAVVLGWQAARTQRAIPKSARVVVNRRWGKGMLNSIRAGLRRVPRGAAFMLYPVDLPLLTPTLLQKVVRAFRDRHSAQAIASPVHRGRAGHPVILAAELRSEFTRARTARNVVEKDPRRVKLVPVNSNAIYADFDTPAELRRLQRALLRRGTR